MTNQITQDRPLVDFDHETPEHAAGWSAKYREMRERCPMAWTSSHGGYWVSTAYRDVIGIAQKDEIFTTEKKFDPETGEVEFSMMIPPMAGPSSIPNETANPEWRKYRTFLNPLFAPKAVETRRANARRFATMLVDRFIESGKCDLVEDLTNPLPAMTTMDLLGVPLVDWRDFADPIHKIMFTPNSSPEFAEVFKGWETIRVRTMKEVNARRGGEAKDFLSYLANGQIDGAPLSDDEIWRIALNIIAGGVDTTTALTSNALLYLSQHPGMRQELIDDPTKRTIAREEFIRYFSPVHGFARLALSDAEFGGQKIRAGERVFLSYAAANRDPAIFQNPEQLDIGRFPNRHVGFGAGMHHCLGSFQARMMFESMLDEVLARIPDYAVDSDAAQRYPSCGSINGWISIPATFTPGGKSRKDLP